MSTFVRVLIMKIIYFRINAEKCKEGDKKYEACSSRQVSHHRKITKYYLWDGNLQKQLCFRTLPQNISFVLLFVLLIKCYNIPRTTILEFANQICERARKFDKDILSEGIQRVGESPHDSCKVYCRSNSGSKTKSWIFPDGTTCRHSTSDIDGTYYCVNGICEVCTLCLRYVISKTKRIN